MGGYARAVTNETGDILVDDIDPKGMKTASTAGAYGRIWCSDSQADAHNGVLGDLLANEDGVVLGEGDNKKDYEKVVKFREQFDLLARYLRNKGLPWGTKITYGFIKRTRSKLRGTIRFIIVDRDHYREIKGSIYRKRA